MTRFDPSLALNRLVVMKDGHSAYDEDFHIGVNIIRGVGNSVGKSTLADLIFFALGGDVVVWKDEAGSCDSVVAELVLNGAVVTVRRDISTSGQQPLWIFFGDFEASQSAGMEGWQRYAYRRSGERESFTQVLFRLLDMPEVGAEAESNITMHQLLRLMYVDQMTPVDRIFRFETNDSPLRRQAVGDLLCGVYDSRIYPTQLLLREKEKDYELATRQLTSLHHVLGRVGEGMTLEFINAQKSNLTSQRSAILAEIDELKSRRFEVSNSADEKSTISALGRDLQKMNADVADKQDLAGRLAYAIEDAGELIREISRSLSQLREGEVSHAVLGPIDFLFCPSCFSVLEDAPDEHTCRLCRSHIEPDSDRSRIARMRNELELQLKESEQLQEERISELAGAQGRLRTLQAMRDRLASEYLSLTRHYVTEADVSIEQLSSRVGYLDRELVELERQGELAEQLELLSREKALLNEDISNLKDRIRQWQTERNTRQANVYGAIAQTTAEIISHDVKSEAEFTSDSDVYFNFSEDRIAINGKYGFSASSLTVIRNAFHLALHWSACADSSFRYPRFLLMDNIEDKGMTQERSQNFQRLIVNISKEIRVPHQIIFTTSMTDPELDNSELTVGEKYDFHHKSLKIGRRPVST